MSEIPRNVLQTVQILQSLQSGKKHIEDMFHLSICIRHESQIQLQNTLRTTHMQVSVTQKSYLFCHGTDNKFNTVLFFPEVMADNILFGLC